MQNFVEFHKNHFFCFKIYDRRKSVSRGCTTPVFFALIHPAAASALPEGGNIFRNFHHAPVPGLHRAPGHVRGQAYIGQPQDSGERMFLRKGLRAVHIHPQRADAALFYSFRQRPF